MARPDSVTNEDIVRWSDTIDQDPYLLPSLAQSPIIREVCFAGLWLAENLEKCGCPSILITRIQWTAGKLSFGRDAWEVHKEILEKYKNEGLIFEEDPAGTKN